MREQFRRPIKQMRLARIEFRRAFVLMLRLHWIAQLLINLCQPVIKLRLLRQRRARVHRDARQGKNVFDFG